MRKRTLLGLIVAAFLLGLLLRQVDLRQLGSALLNVRPELLTFGLAVEVAVMWIKSLRWSMAIRGATGHAVSHAFSASLIGFAGNVLLPVRLGELIRIGVINKHNRIGRSLALTTIGLTQLFDLLALAGYAIVVSVWAAGLVAPHLWNIIVLGLLAILTLGMLLVLQDKSALVGAVLTPISRRLPARLERPITWYARLFVKGLGVLGRGPLLSRVLLLTIVVWVTATLGTYLILHAFHIDANLLTTAILVVVLNLSFAFPLTPGNVGVNQALSVFLLGGFGVPPVTALAYSIGSQGARYLLIVSLGIACFWREGMDFDLFRPMPKPEKFAESSTQK